MIIERILPCFAMFCQSFPLHFDGILQPEATGRIWSPHPDMEHPGPEPRAGEAAKARKLSHRKLQVQSGPWIYRRIFQWLPTRFPGHG